MLRLALVSYEFAGSSNGGGIGTYFREIFQMMRAIGHSVEVFTAGSIADHSDQTVHCIDVQRQDFAEAVAPVFLKRHAADPFDVLETAEYGADAVKINVNIPDMAKVVKLHTPTYLINEINAAYFNRIAKARYIFGAIRRGRLPSPPRNKYSLVSDVERQLVLDAHDITSPSRDLAKLISARWLIEPDKIHVVPNPFKPADAVRSIPSARASNRVTFIGKLEVRKGVLELAKAIPRVLERLPETKFRLVGRSLPHPSTKRDLVEHLKNTIGKQHLDHVEFTGGVSHNEIPHLLSETDIAVFPSYWENFPYVCLEAMSAACGVVASQSGGMAEMIENGRTGLLINPKKPREIADAIISLLEAPEKRIVMGTAAREHVLDTYSADRIAPLQIASYERAIENARKRNMQGTGAT